MHIMSIIFKTKKEVPKSFSSRENLFLSYANNEGADQPVHPRSLISAFVIRFIALHLPHAKFQCSN